MARRRKRTQKSDTKMKEFVAVAIAKDEEQALEYQTLLQSNDINASVKEQTDQITGAKNYAVMVDEDFIDEAYVVIESQDAYDDFYDMSLEDEDDMDFDSELFDEEL